ncbi:glycosyltransferase [Pseudarthrobacter raffinosi]|uniref:glycosyltransferase n=1 Tax=Pseudarthrobacter raffinosi TaxID=2953651 RepID=UPI00208E3F4F|nr:glycosyltransferase [Pseudarthrobacter sp. MDT3-9]MCO4253145.1 glycosyltransferase [Pseudarthrobacter sp. MDT3-9]
MRIIQIATLVTPDGAYGGPVRVAVNQARALLAAGHEVELAAAARGFGRTLPTHFDGVPVRLFRARTVPKLGFSGTFSPGLQRWLRSAIGSAEVVHIHMGRDMVTLPSAQLARRRQVPYVLQTHGMITPSSHPFAGLVDRRWTVPALENAKKVLFLTAQESTDLKSVAHVSPLLEPLRNGVPNSASSSAKKTTGLEVLFLARLHERKRPLMFVELAKRLHPIFPDVKFVLAGPDGGLGTEIKKAILASGISKVLNWEGAIAPDRTTDRISRCDVYVLPSINEPYPMSVLEALSLGKPTVITETCGLAEAIIKGKAGFVVDATIGSLLKSVTQLLSDDVLREQMGRNARDLAQNDFGMKQIVERLEYIYGGALDIVDQRR